MGCMGWKVEMEGKVVSVISYRSWKAVLDKPGILLKGLHLSYCYQYYFAITSFINAGATSSPISAAQTFSSKS